MKFAKIRMETTKLKGQFVHMAKDWIFIVLGIFSYSFGFTAFVLPEKIVMGALAGLSALVYYAIGFPPGVFLWVANFAMLFVALKVLSRQFTIRTLIGVTLMSTFISLMQPFFIEHPLITAGEDKFMHVLIGACLCGAGMGLVFSHNGSQGGTDIILALLNKHFRMSFGRAMQFIDCTIIGSSYVLFHSAETIVYGLAFTLVASYVCDYVVNGNRQTVQFVIISKEYKQIADMVNKEMGRGVTLIEGKGWYSKAEVDLLIIMVRKYESQEIFNYIKEIDPNAMVSQTFCHGVFGHGFDAIK